MMTLAAPEALAGGAAPAQRRPPAEFADATRRERPLRVLVFTSLFPSEVRPRHGIFVETRLTHLINDCPVDARVIAPVPWFPWASSWFGPYAQFAATPRRATRANGLAVTHPRYLMLPRIGVKFQPDAMARSALGEVMRLRQSGWVPDVIDAHYLYPDGVAAAWLARQLNVPFVMTARGTDVNVLARLPGPAQRIAEAARQAAAVIAVSKSLKDSLVALGVDERKVEVLRNGVDTEVFRPEERAASRARLGLPLGGPLVASVGNLVAEKGQVLAIESLLHLAGASLVIVGDGPMRGQLMAAAQQLGVAPRVILRSAMPQHELRHVYAASDVLMLTSTREGWPNVVLEALACGTPVATVDVGAVREMISDARVGRIIAGRDPRMMATAVGELLNANVPRDVLRLHAARFDWASISRAQWNIFTRVVASTPSVQPQRA